MNLHTLYDLTQSNPCLCFRKSPHGNIYRFIYPTKELLLWTSNQWHKVLIIPPSFLTYDWTICPHPALFTWPEVAARLKLGDQATYVSENGKFAIRANWVERRGAFLIEFLRDSLSVLEFFDHKWEKLG